MTAMNEDATREQDEIYSKVLRAGRRTYFFDVRATKANDFYLTVTESKKHEGANGEAFYKKHKIYLYKEDFERFRELMDDAMEYIINEKGEEVISERHNPAFKRENGVEEDFGNQAEAAPTSAFTNVNFDEI
jgi:hypothetical protein